jgi:hypothetical protein
VLANTKYKKFIMCDKKTICTRCDKPCHRPIYRRCHEPCPALCNKSHQRFKKPSLLEGATTKRVASEIKKQRLQAEKHAEFGILTLSVACRTLDAANEYNGCTEPMFGAAFNELKTDSRLRGTMKHMFHADNVRQGAAATWQVAGYDTLLAVLGVFEEQILKVAGCVLGGAAADVAVAARKKQLAIESNMR